MGDDLFGGALPVPLPAQIKEVEREIAQRERVYPRWVAAGKMPQATADRHIANMRAVLATLREVFRLAAELRIERAGA